MDEITTRKRIALLRNRELMQMLKDAAKGQDDKGEEWVPETGSVFVLRQMLERRARMKEMEKEREKAGEGAETTAETGRVAFT